MIQKTLTALVLISASAHTQAQTPPANTTPAPPATETSPAEPTGATDASGATEPLAIRDWTSADGSRTFQGTLIGIQGSMITVKRADGTDISFEVGLVSEADQKYVTENSAKVGAPPAPKVENPVAKEMAGNLAGGTVSSGADYYILYFAASF